MSEKASSGASSHQQSEMGKGGHGGVNMRSDKIGGLLGNCDFEEMAKYGFGHQSMKELAGGESDDHGGGSGGGGSNNSDWGGGHSDHHHDSGPIYQASVGDIGYLKPTGTPAVSSDERGGHSV